MGLLKSVFFTGLTFLSTSTSANLLSVAPLNAVPLSSISINNQERKVRPQIVNVNNEESILFPFSIKTNKCGKSCNNIINPHAKLCVPDAEKNLKNLSVQFNVKN